MPRPALFLALLLVLPLAAARADDDATRSPLLVLDGATVLASPGAPKALEAFLPGAKAPGRLAWPLPADELARRLCDVFHLDVDDLGGGYRIWAWHATTRPLVFVMGADPAALQAARFEFDMDAPAEMLAPGMRSLDFKRPNQEAVAVIHAGTRDVRPRYRTRAWAPGDTVRRADAITAGGAMVGRVWLEGAREPDGSTAALLGALRAQGVTPVVAATIEGALDDADAGTRGHALAHTLRAWQAQHGVQHFALRFEAAPAAVRSEGVRAPAHEAAIARTVADALRPGGLAELVVVPRCFSDRLAQDVAPPPDLRGIPEAVVAWSGPSEHATRITRTQAERRVGEAGVPVVLLETWMDPAWAGAGRSRIPTLPRGRDADLPEVLDGIVVPGRRDTSPLLESAWQPLDEHRLGLGLLQPLVPSDGADPAAFAAALARTLRAADEENAGLVPWMTPLADALLAQPADASVPVVPQRVTADGRIDERPWGFARKLVGSTQGAEVFVLSDGDALRFAVRIPNDAGTDAPFLLQIALEAPGRTERWHVELTPEGARIDRSGRADMPKLEPGHVQAAWLASQTHFQAEVTFDRFALGGEPHAGRLFQCGISWGPTNLWPAGSTNGVMGRLLVTR